MDKDGVHKHASLSIILWNYQCLVCVKIIQKTQVNIFIQVSEKDKIAIKTAKQPRITESVERNKCIAPLCHQ
jgi:hypothetical protein